MRAGDGVLRLQKELRTGGYNQEDRQRCVSDPSHTYRPLNTYTFLKMDKILFLEVSRRNTKDSASSRDAGHSTSRHRPPPRKMLLLCGGPALAFHAGAPHSARSGRAVMMSAAGVDVKTLAEAQAEMAPSAAHDRAPLSARSYIFSYYECGQGCTIMMYGGSYMQIVGP